MKLALIFNVFIEESAGITRGKASEDKNNSDLKVGSQGSGVRGQEPGVGESRESPIPNSQFPIPNSQFPIPNSQFPIPNSQFQESPNKLDMLNATIKSENNSLVISPYTPAFSAFWCGTKGCLNPSVYQ